MWWVCLDLVQFNENTSDVSVRLGQWLSFIHIDLGTTNYSPGEGEGGSGSETQGYEEGEG